MMLLIWSSERAQDCAKSIEHAFQQPVHLVEGLDRACELLKSSTFSAVLLDQWVVEGSPGEVDAVFQHLGNAVPVIVNFAISGIDRVLRSIQAALEYRSREAFLARQSACSTLRCELKDDVTALLLSCGIALQESSLTEAAAERVKKIDEIANQIRRKLLARESNETGTAAHA